MWSDHNMDIQKDQQEHKEVGLTCLQPIGDHDKLGSCPIEKYDSQPTYMLKNVEYGSCRIRPATVLPEKPSLKMFMQDVKSQFKCGPNSI